MDSMTFKLEREQIFWLKEQARTKQTSQSSVVRDLIDQQRGGRSLHDRMKHLCGCVKNAPKDLSTRKLTGYGRD
jgi:hypothetical protein